jgi:hypothetical protein
MLPAAVAHLRRQSTVRSQTGEPLFQKRVGRDAFQELPFFWIVVWEVMAAG